MMSWKFLCLATLSMFCLVSLASGDVIRVTGEPRELTPKGQYFMQPIWSPLGDQMALAGANYQGLWTIHREGHGLKQISDQMGAGFLPVWSSDGQRIATRVTEVQNKRRLSSVAVLDLEKGTATELTEYAKEIGRPSWIDRDRKLFLSKGKKTLTVEAPGTAKTEISPADLILYLRDGAMVLRQWPEEEENVLQPVEGDILWAELSPDKGFIIFELLGAQLYVIQTDGGGLVNLGRGERPRWSPDGRWITYMITEDDGHRMLSADIYAISRDGSAKTAITETAERLEMNPHWSPDGRLIACDTRGEGVILLIPVETERSYPPER
jgi:Tol biopolymer transport system component